LHIKVRLYINVTKYSVEEHSEWLKETAGVLARTKENTIDIINALLEYLIKEQIELPAFSTLNRIAINARAQANQGYYSEIVDELPSTTLKLLNNILLYDNSEGQTLWHLIKQEPEKPSVTNLQRFIDHTRWLKSMDLRIGTLPHIPEQKRQQFYFVAIAYSRDKMASLTRKNALHLLPFSSESNGCDQPIISSVCLSKKFENATTKQNWISPHFKMHQQENLKNSFACSEK
jgi:hypothetical protein